MVFRLLHVGEGTSRYKLANSSTSMILIDSHNLLSGDVVSTAYNPLKLSA
jgi:hypothetical protein